MRKFTLWGNVSRYDIEGELANYKKAWAELDHKVEKLETLTGLSIDTIIAAFERGCNLVEPFNPKLVEGEN